MGGGGGKVGAREGIKTRDKDTKKERKEGEG